MMATFWKAGILAIVLASAFALPPGDSTASDLENEIERTTESVGASTDSSSVTSTAEQGTTEDRERLLQDLFKGYNKNNYPSHVKVKFGITVIRFDVNEKEKNLEVDVFLREQWQDERLRWDPEEYGKNSVIRVNSEDVWKPDLTLYNSASQPGVPRCSSPNLLVFSTGKVVHVPACHEKPFCNLTLTREPYGEQTCVMKYGSWTFDGDSMDIQFYQESKADISALYDTSDWTITGNTGERVEKIYPCCKEPYITLEHEFKFQRKAV